MASVRLLIISRRFLFKLLTVSILPGASARDGKRRLGTATSAWRKGLSIMDRTSRRRFDPVTFMVSTIWLKGEFFASGWKVRITSTQGRSAVRVIRSVYRDFLVFRQ